MSFLQQWGWNPTFQSRYLARNRPDLQPCRIIAEHRGGYRLISSQGELNAKLTGKLRHAAESRQAVPAVGDWVLVSHHDGDAAAQIHDLLPRISCFSRRSAGAETVEQIVAANLDVVFLVMALNRDFNLHRLERYLALSYESGAAPEVLLTKADLTAEPEAYVLQILEISPGLPIHVTSVLEGHGIAELRDRLQPGQTIALLGSSGAGKSSVANALLGRERFASQETRSGDDRGRHTTVHRQLIQLDHGALLLDTPGMRELQLWGSDEGLRTAFDEIVELSHACRFTDCRHQDEPGCAVKRALQEGQLHSDRLAHYQKLERELHDQNHKNERKRTLKARSKLLRQMERDHPRY